MKNLFYIVLFAALVSCGGQKRPDRPVPANFFSGEFVYFADAAVFYDCATGEKYPVAMRSDYIKAERGYMEMKPEMGERVYMSFHGHVEYLPGMEDGTRERTMVIDSFTGFNRGEKCAPQYSLSGVYQSEGGGIKSSLRLRIDYTFTEITYDNDGVESTREGTWGMASKLELVLDYDGGEE